MILFSLYLDSTFGIISLNHREQICFEGIFIMENKTKLLRIVLILLTVAVLPFNVKLLTADNANMFFTVGTCLNIISLVFLVIYLAYGFKKKAQLSYKGFLHCFCLNLITACLTIASYGNSKQFLFILAVNIVCFGIVVMLAFSENLGWRKSIILCYILIALRFFALIGIIFSSIHLANGFIRSLTLLFTSVMLAVMTYAKYQDKISRGRGV